MDSGNLDLAGHTFFENKNLKGLLLHGVAAARGARKELADAYFNKALQLDRDNEVALLWMATLATNPFDARNFLQRLLSNNPSHQLAITYYKLADQRCSELDNLIFIND